MKFIFADSLDLVDPGFDFLNDRTLPFSSRSDCYPHELMDPPPYQGILISRAIVGDYRVSGKYRLSQNMRLRREGARKFLRLTDPCFSEMLIFGDCGAFTYASEDKPRYSCALMLEFYSDAEMTHGCSVDHIVFDFDREEIGREAIGSESARARYDVTLENANEFFKLSRSLAARFTPIGVVQGWSPSSMARAAVQLEKMGYTYLAIGGLVRLRAPDIHRCLSTIRERIRADTRVHLLGCAKEEIDEFAQYGIESFDSTSPLLRAFKDARANYYVLTAQGLQYYTALRIPQATESRRLVHAVREGTIEQEWLVNLESRTLRAVRGYDKGTVTLEDAAELTAEYGSWLAPEVSIGSSPSREKLRASIRESATRTLRDRPWSRCQCSICRAAGVEVLIFRGTNRNKRRGFHNLGVYNAYCERIRQARSLMNERSRPDTCSSRMDQCG